MSSMSSVQCHRCFGLHRARATRAQSMWCAGGLVTGRAHLRSQRIRARSQCPPRPCSSACSVAEKKHSGQRAESVAVRHRDSRSCRPLQPARGLAVPHVGDLRSTRCRMRMCGPHPLVPVRVNRTRSCPCARIAPASARAWWSPCAPGLPKGGGSRPSRAARRRRDSRACGQPCCGARPGARRDACASRAQVEPPTEARAPSVAVTVHTKRDDGPGASCPFRRRAR